MDSDFAKAASGEEKKLYHTSVRVNKEVKEWIDTARGELSVSDYYRSLVLTEMGNKGDLPKRRRHEPVKDHVELARGLALLGRARLISNMAQIAEHLNKGTLPVWPRSQAIESHGQGHTDFLGARDRHHRRYRRGGSVNDAGAARLRPELRKPFRNHCRVSTPLT